MNNEASVHAYNPRGREKKVHKKIKKACDILEIRYNYIITIKQHLLKNMREINVEPDWPSMWAFIQNMKIHDRDGYNKFVQNIGDDQIEAIEHAAKVAKG